MNHQLAINEAFLGKAFLRPLFYGYAGGLRFELSEGGHVIDQFLTAHRKAFEICRDIFPTDDTLIVCFRACYFQESRFTYRSSLRELTDAGIKIPRSRSIWVDPAVTASGFVDQSLYVAFSASAHLLARLLWCALSADFGSIRPRPLCTVYLFNLGARIMALPYDDRGMDVVGPNKELLANLYRKHEAYLLAHDRETMRATFEPEAAHQNPAKK